MGKFIFVIGGIRSGKSRFAQELAKKISKKVVFIATCVPQDEEMKKRIARHKKSRPRSWKTIEEPKNIERAFGRLKNKFDAVIIDCLGLLVSNFLSDGLDESKIERKIKSITKILLQGKFTSIVVSNEVGSGLVPVNPLARRFSDALGMVNQAMAKKAEVVIHMQSGIPIAIKGGKRYAKIK